MPHYCGGRVALNGERSTLWITSICYQSFPVNNSPLEKHQKPQVLHMFFVVNGAKGTEEGAN